LSRCLRRSPANFRSSILATSHHISYLNRPSRRFFFSNQRSRLSIDDLACSAVFLRGALDARLPPNRATACGAPESDSAGRFAFGRLVGGGVLCTIPNQH